jgi:hypothetical protein
VGHPLRHRGAVVVAGISARLRTLDASVPITLSVLAIAFVKARLIIRYFMEVRTAPRWLRICTDGWLVVFFGAVPAMYFW